MADVSTFIIYASIYIGLVATAFYILSFISDTKKEKKFFSDKELPFVSVIIPAFNEEKSIERTINSIKKSEYPEKKLEIIVVDDGSKDNTFKIAKKMESDIVKVFTKENGGKGSALNLGIKHSRGEIIITMDADTFVEPSTLKKMARYFKNPEVFSVTPAMLVHSPKGILQRIQHVEYVLGLFLRKSFASLNSVYITPGAFSAYRKKFFEKHGGYDVGNITEDLEIALRIQSYGYKIENCPDAAVYTIAPSSFRALMKQRRRWYYGLMKNTWKYKKLLSPKYGDMGLFVMPISWISIFFAVFVFIYFALKTLRDIKNEILFFLSINLNPGALYLNLYALERYIFLLASNPVVIFLLIFMGLTFFYIIYASKRQVKVSGVFTNLPLFYALFAILFGFWWVISIGYLILNKKVGWR